MKQRLDLLHRQAGNRKRSIAQPSTIRNDDPIGVMKHAGRYAGGKALVILGGESGSQWQQLKEQIKPDVILGGNGVNAAVNDLDYWMIAENMNYTSKQAAIGNPRAIEFMEMFYRESGAKTKLISHLSWNLLKDTTNCISIKRMTVTNNFSLRIYGDGFMAGPIYNNQRILRLPQRIGNVGVHLLHMAGILGCAEIHTIGFDMVFRNKDHHHFYKYPIYQLDRFRMPDIFVNYKGMDTQVIWIEIAKFLKSMEPCFDRDGIKWVDHSEGLLKLEGLKCAL